MPIKYKAHEGAIRQFLTDRDMQVQELAAKAGLSRKTVSLSINGEPMSWHVVSRIAVALDVAPHAICTMIDGSEAVAG